MLSLLESFRKSDSKDASNNEISKSVVTDVTGSSVAHSTTGEGGATIELVVALGDNVLDVIGETA